MEGGGERRRVMEGGRPMEGGGALGGGKMEGRRVDGSYSPQLIVTHVCSGVLAVVCGQSPSFTGICLHLWVQVVSWVLVIHAWGLLSSMLSFVVAVAVLGLGCRLWAPHRHSWVVGLICRRCTLFMAGGLMFVGCGYHTHVG